MSFKKWLAVLAALFLFGLSAAADATMMVFLSREDLVRRSDVVARVRVGKAVSVLSEDGRSIVTRTEITVTQLLKGKAEERVVVAQVGGTWNGKTQKILGDGSLRPGEDAVVFLRRGDKGNHHFTALSLSVYHVDAKGVAKREVEGVSFMQYDAGKLVPSVHIEAPEAVESLMTDIVRLAGGK